MYNTLQHDILLKELRCLLDQLADCIMFGV